MLMLIVDASTFDVTYLRSDRPDPGISLLPKASEAREKAREDGRVSDGFFRAGFTRFHVSREKRHGFMFLNLRTYADQATCGLLAV